MIDAFSSDAIPTHLVTAEALRMYLAKLKPGGVLLMNLTNRHLELRDPVIAALRSLGVQSLTQQSPGNKRSILLATPTVALVASPDARVVAGLARDPRWVRRDPGRTAPWTDDYSNIFGAFIARHFH